MTEMVHSNRMMSRLTVFFFIMLFLAFPCAAGEKIVLASLEWPPYAGESLVGNGASSMIVREAFRAVGLDLEIRFYPWNRLLHEMANDPSIQGYFPEYAGREELYNYSNSIGKSPIGFAKRTSTNVSWNTYEDLQNYRIGVVSGYINTKRFDEMVTAGEVRINTTGFDRLNLRKVLQGRVEMAVVDMNVFRFFVRTDPILYPNRTEIEMDPHLMDISTLYVCFPKTENGKRLQSLFNKGLREVPVRLLQNKYLDELLKSVGRTVPAEKIQ
jgi:polar amino acid transport system substrate-binding protein